MSQITRCPACATQFKVVPDQLRISEGWVRCGQCKQVFDAVAHLMVPAQPDLLPGLPLGRGDARPGAPAGQALSAGSSARSATPRAPGVTLSQPLAPAASPSPSPPSAAAAPWASAAGPATPPAAAGLRPPAAMPPAAAPTNTGPVPPAPAPAEIPAYLAKGAAPIEPEPGWTLAPASRDPWRDRGLPRSLPSSELPPGPVTPPSPPPAGPAAPAPAVPAVGGFPPPSAGPARAEPAPRPAAPSLSDVPVLPPAPPPPAPAPPPWAPPADLEPLPPIEMPEPAPDEAPPRHAPATPASLRSAAPSRARDNLPVPAAEGAPAAGLPPAQAAPSAPPDLAAAEALSASPGLRDEGATVAEGLVPDDPPPAASADPQGGSAAVPVPPAPDAGPDTATEAVEPDPVAENVGFVRAARRQAFWRRPLVRLVLTLCGLGLATLLAAQVAVQERDRIAALDPRARPWLQALCEPLDCEIQPLRDINAVVIDSSSFTKGRGDSYQLAVSVKNRAAHAVATPAIELTLTDAQDQPVLRKVLLPQDIVAPPELPARGEWNASVGVVVTTGGARVAGYRMLVFYP